VKRNKKEHPQLRQVYIHFLYFIHRYLTENI